MTDAPAPHPSWRYRTFGRSRSVRLSAEEYSVEGRTYFATPCCRDRRPCFADAAAADIVFDTWREAVAVKGYHLWALCIMPDHLHLLAMCGPMRIPLGRMIGAAKTLSLTRSPRGALAWQARFHDHIVREEESILDFVCYIVNNPCNAGLIEDWREWPWTYVDESLIP